MIIPFLKSINLIEVLMIDFILWKKMIYLWKKEIIDIEEFEVRVLSNQEETIFHGKGNYPTSYPSFLKLLEVPYDR